MVVVVAVEMVMLLLPRLDFKYACKKYDVQVGAPKTEFRRSV